MSAIPIIGPYVVPIIEFVGTTLGILGAADAVDTALGSPIKHELDLIEEPEQPGDPVDYDVLVSERAEAEKARSYNEGLNNYFRTLESLAPGFVDRNRTRLKENYRMAIDNREARIEELSNTN
jgi:hypothetical protein